METRNYETVFIANPHAPDQKIQDINTRNQQIIESLDGKVLNLDDWGKKKMAYAIRKEAKGHYFCLTYKANTKAVAELERNMRINEDVLRYMSIRVDEHEEGPSAMMQNRGGDRNDRGGDRGDRGYRGGMGRGPRPPRRDDRDDRGDVGVAVQGEIE